MSDTELDALVTAVTAATKYRCISPDLIRRIGTRELAVRRSTKEAIKATKNKLHQIGAAYQPGRINYKKAKELLLAAADLPDALEEAALAVMQLHTSTNERLSILPDFYAQIFAHLPPIHSVLDLACGLNPLAVPWMRPAAGVTYFACDIYTDMMQFLAEVFPLFGVQGKFEVRDVVGQPPDQPVDLALILKTLPVLDQVDKTAVPRLFDTLQAAHLLVTFPVRSLGGRGKGMVSHYTRQLETWVDGRSWQTQRLEFETELAFLITCQS
ncbi:MAG: hypothetical protein KC419_03250 [Anaerolineales bacterium]|nr:hypothetical protein [Anaerolineales bacterium]MCA9927462.1 hypothetical protein [Anaerolineales bacterium]